MSIEAMKQALEALDGLSEPYDVLKAQHALRTAIEQAEKQEPVAWGMKSLGGDFIIDCITPEEHESYEGAYTIPLYTTPPAAQQEPVATYTCGVCGVSMRMESPAAQRQWVGLTEEEINEYDYEHRDFIYDIEALLKHKNTRLG